MNNLLKIKVMTIKNPQWRKVFLLWLADDKDLDCYRLEKAFLTLLTYKKLLKNEITIQYATSLLKNKEINENIIEIFENKIHKTLHEKQKKNFISSLKTKNYIHLFNNQISKEINSILDNDISIYALKNHFFHKIARYKRSNDLLIDLIQFKEKNIGWNKKSYLDNITNKKLNVEILKNENNTLLVHVIDYKACHNLGSQAWCITNNHNHFTEYTDGKKQFIYFNFNKSIEDNESIIGLTVHLFFGITHSHLKNDKKAGHSAIGSLGTQIKALLKKESNDWFNHERNNQQTFIQICQYGLIKSFDEYLKKDDVYANAFNNMAIRLAAKNGHDEIVRRLLIDPSVDSSVGNYTVFKEAVRFGYVDIINFFFEKWKGDHNSYPSGSSTGWGYDAFCIACTNEYFDIAIRLQKDLSIDPSHNNNSAIIRAAYFGKLNTFRFLLKDPRVDAAADDSQAFISAADNGNIDIINELLEIPGINPSTENNAAFKIAVHRGHLNIVNVLLEDPRIDISKDIISLLKTAIQWSRTEIFMILMQKFNICPSIENNLFIKIASSTGNIELVEYLNDNINVDPSVDNNRPLMDALKHEYFEIVHILIQETSVSEKLEETWIQENLYPEQIALIH
jgi:ankyrin repeat protein